MHATAGGPFRDNFGRTVLRGHLPPPFPHLACGGRRRETSKSPSALEKGFRRAQPGRTCLDAPGGSSGGQHARGPGGRSVQRRPLVRRQAQRRLHPRPPAGSAETERPSERRRRPGARFARPGRSPFRRAGRDDADSTASMAPAVTDPGIRRGLCARGRGRPVSGGERLPLRGKSEPPVGMWARAAISLGREPWGIEARAESYREGSPGTEREPRKGSSRKFFEIAGGPWSAEERVRILRARAMARGGEEPAGAAAGGAGAPTSRPREGHERGRRGRRSTTVELDVSRRVRRELERVVSGESRRPCRLGDVP